MPRETHTPRTSFRLARDVLATLDRLGPLLAPEGCAPLGRTDVLRVAIARLAEQVEAPKASAASEGSPMIEKKSKNPRTVS